jgi:hypothetical protein
MHIFRKLIIVCNLLLIIAFAVFFICRGIFVLELLPPLEGEESAPLWMSISLFGVYLAFPILTIVALSLNRPVYKVTNFAASMNPMLFLFIPGFTIVILQGYRVSVVIEALGIWLLIFFVISILNSIVLLDRIRDKMKKRDYWGTMLFGPAIILIALFVDLLRS